MPVTLTQAQKTTLKNHIAANNNQVSVGGGPLTAIKDLPNDPDSNVAIAQWYNIDASPDFIVWRDLSMETVLDTITFASMTPADAVPSVTALGSNPTAAQQATYDNQVAALQAWQARSLSCQGKQFNLHNLTIGRATAPMKKTNYRAAMQDCLTNIPAGSSGANIAANWVGVRDGAKFKSNNVERLFAAGTGSSASPGDLVIEGTIGGAMIQLARDQG